MLLVVGSYSKAINQGIHCYRLDESEETFIPAGSIGGIENPSYLCVADPEGIIYVIRENKNGTASELRIYEPHKNDLPATLTDIIPFEGAGSCYISINTKRTHAFVANYGSGTLTVFRLPQERISGKVVQQLAFSGTGPEPERQEQPHLHAACLSKDERYLFCTDLGSDRLYRFNYFPEADVPLQAQEPPYVRLPPGSGPRHLALSPNGRWLYLITELSGEIFVFPTDDPDAGWIQRISIVQEGFQGKIEGGDIQVHNEGHFLYASNRGDANELVLFSIDQESGHLSFLQRTTAAGLSPRSLLICEPQGLLLAADEQSDDVSIFKLKTDGRLEFTQQRLHLPAPTCLKTMKIEPI